ncbi:hypothetical protein PYCC9005_000664 [Savitreella phatthalungensis]
MTDKVLYSKPLREAISGSGETPESSDEPGSNTEPHSGPSAHQPPPRTTYRKLRILSKADSVSTRFHALFATALSTRLTPRESAQFLDQFRYIICTSSLLGDKIAPPTERRSAARAARQRPWQTEDQAGWDKRRIAKHWMGSGGCVVLASLLLTWAIQTPPKSGGLPKGKARQSAALVVGLVLTLFLYAQTRKAQSRLNHEGCVRAVTALVESCHLFDMQACRIIQLVQEVELLARGYQLAGQDTPRHLHPPISRLEKYGQQRRCETLRRAAAAALNLIHAATDRTLSALMEHSDTHDFYKLADVYNVVLGGDDAVDDMEDEESIAGLRSLLNRLHARRRSLFCALLAIQAPARWGQVGEKLSTLNDLFGSVARSLADTLEQDSKPLDLNQLVTHNDDPAPAKSLQSVNQLGLALRRAQARMYLLRDAEATDELLTRYDALGKDLELLVSEWRDGRSFLTRDQGTAPGVDEAQDTPDDVLEQVDTASVRMRPDSLGFWGPRMSVHLDDTQVRGLGLAPGHMQEHQPVIYEADATPRAAGSTNTLTRADRLAAMRKERDAKQARTAQRRLEQQTRENVVSELKDVLGSRAASASAAASMHHNTAFTSRRPMGLRLSVHAAPRSSSAAPATLRSLNASIPEIPRPSDLTPHTPSTIRRPPSSSDAPSTATATARQMALLMRAHSSNPAIMSPPLDNGDRKASTRSDSTWDSAFGGSLAS